MTNPTFFVPSASFGGRFPRLREPFVDLGLRVDGWIPGVVEDGRELAGFLTVFEPLLLAINVAGYTVPEITIVSADQGHFVGGLVFDTESAHVALLDDEASAAAQIFAQPSGLQAHMRLSPVVTVGEGGVLVSRAIALNVEGLSGTGLLIGADGSTTDDPRSRFRTAVVEPTRSCLADLGTASGLTAIYDWRTWIDRGGVGDAPAAMAGIAVALHGEVPSAGVADLLADLGGLDASGTLQPFATVSMYHRLAATPLASADPDWLVSILRTALATIDADDCSACTYTGALLELSSRGAIDLLGPVLEMTVPPSDDQAAEILAKPPGLDAPDIDALCVYLAAGRGVHSDEVSGRLASEYPLTDEPVVQGAIVDGLISACEVTEPHPLAVDEEPLAGSFEVHIVSLARVMSHEVWVSADSERTGAFITDLWQRWAERLSVADLAERFHYGGALLFLRCADTGTQVEIADALVRFYPDRVGPGWRFPDQPDVDSHAPIGWSAAVLAELCRTVRRASDDPRYAERAREISAEIGPLVGSGLLELCGVTASDVASYFAGLLELATADLDAGQPLSDYRDLTVAIAARYDDADPIAADAYAGRLRLPIVVWRTQELLAANGDLVDELARLKLLAFEDVTAAKVTGDAAALQQAWFTDPATLEYRLLLTDAEQEVFDERELAVVAYGDPAVASACVEAATGSEIVGASRQFVSGFDDATVEDAYTELFAAIGATQFTEGDVATAVGLVKDGVSIVENALPNVFDEAFADEVAILRHLDESGQLGRSYANALADLTAWKQRASLKTVLGSRIVAAAAGLIAAHQLAQADFTGTGDAIGKIVTVATGATASLEIGVYLLEVITVNVASRPSLAAPLLDDALAFVGLVSKLAGIVGLVLAVVSLSDALAAGDPFDVTVSAIGLAGGVASYFFGTALVFGTIPLGQVIALGLFVLALAVMAYKIWTREPDYYATLHRLEALWDESVAIEVPVEAFTTGYDGSGIVLLGRTISTSDVVVNVEVAPDAPEAPPLGTWTSAMARLRWFGEGTASSFKSPLPGRVSGHEIAIEQVLRLSRTVMTIVPVCEHVVRSARAGMVTAWSTDLGALVTADESILSVGSDRSTETIEAGLLGRVQEMVPIGTVVDVGDVLFRIQLDEFEIVVIGERP